MHEIFAAGLHESINQSIKSYANKKEFVTKCHNNYMSYTINMKKKNIFKSVI
jgi:hypothetical protein